MNKAAGCQPATFLPWAIDTHCHLDHEKFGHEHIQVIGEAHNAGVHYIIVPGCDVATSRRSLELADRFPGVWSAVGVHPHEASHAENALPGIEQLVKEKKVVAVGEIGLDYHYDFSSPAEQQDAFRRQIQLAQMFNMPMIIHVREAWDDARRMLEAENAFAVPLVFHAFSGDENDARWVCERGGFIGIGGMISFVKADGMRQIVSGLPHTQVVLETDAPYLAPVPFRGKRNNPANAAIVARKLAELWYMDELEVRAVTSLNARQLFTLPRSGEGCATYRLKDNLYINMTNRCPNDCVFCLRRGCDGLDGSRLWLDLEPTHDELLAEVVSAISQRPPHEVVFCGFGEPTMRWNDVVTLAKYIRKSGIRTRLDTNGLGNLINGRNIIPELVECFDAVSVSLNAADDISYNRLCRSRYAGAFGAVVGFIRECASAAISTTASMVAGKAEGAEEVRKMAEDLGVGFRIRGKV